MTDQNDRGSTKSGKSTQEIWKVCSNTLKRVTQNQQGWDTGVERTNKLLFVRSDFKLSSKYKEYDILQALSTLFLVHPAQLANALFDG